MNDRGDSIETLRRLREGNLAFRARGRTPGLELAPLGAARDVAVVCCSDLRLSPEIVFDQRYGNLLVVQTPGPVVDDAVTTSLRYGIDKLGVKLVLVLAHVDCITLRGRDGASSPSASRFRECVERALGEARGEGEAAARENAARQAKQLERELASAVSIVPAVMHADGEVELIG